MNKEFVKKELLPLLLRLAVLAVLFTAVALNYDRLVNIDVRALVDLAPGEIAAILVGMAIFFLKGLTFVIPAMLIYVSVGMAFDLGTALFISLCGIAVEVAVTYWLGRMLGGEYVNRLLKKAKGGEKLLNMQDKSKFSSLFVIRLLPVFPIDFASLFLGSIKLPFIKYMFVSVLGIAPRVIAFTLVGDRIYEIFPMDLLLKAVLVLVPVIAVVFIVMWVIKQKKKKKEVQP
ncbi:MAG: VTT domain-containing protein [Clostridia bacterium]|nr:VTT domain-containing protein [Clostridia bacterium]